MGLSSWLRAGVAGDDVRALGGQCRDGLPGLKPLSDASFLRLPSSSSGGLQGPSRTETQLILVKNKSFSKMGTLCPCPGPEGGLKLPGWWSRCEVFLVPPSRQAGRQAERGTWGMDPPIFPWGLTLFSGGLVSLSPLCPSPHRNPTSSSIYSAPHTPGSLEPASGGVSLEGGPGGPCWKAPPSGPFCSLKPATWGNRWPPFPDCSLVKPWGPPRLLLVASPVSPSYFGKQ